MKKILLVALMALCAASLSYAEIDEECTTNCAEIYGASDNLLIECYKGCPKTNYNATPNVRGDDSSSERSLNKSNAYVHPGGNVLHKNGPILDLLLDPRR